MRADDRIRLKHMVDAADAAIGFVRGKQRADLDHDQMLLFALGRAIEIVGEAAGKLSDEARTQSPSVPWPAIISIASYLFLNAMVTLSVVVFLFTPGNELASMSVMLLTMPGRPPRQWPCRC